MQSLLKSRKFWLAVFAVAQAIVLNYFNLPEQLWQAIAGVVAVLIGSIAVEDAGSKSGTSVQIREIGLENPETPDAEGAQK